MNSSQFPRKRALAVAATVLCSNAMAYTPTSNTDAVIDTEHVRVILLDTNHPAGDCEGSIGAAQLEWLEARLSEVEPNPAAWRCWQATMAACRLPTHTGAIQIVTTPWR